MTVKKKLWFSITTKDCIFKTFKAPGKGGQKKNKTVLSIRCTHIASGAVGECSEYKEQSRNKQTAFKRMTENVNLKSWHQMKIWRRDW